MLKTKPAIGVVAGVIGLILGIIYGWVINPVEYKGAGPEHLLPQFQGAYLQAMADAYAANGNKGQLDAGFSGWPLTDVQTAACTLANTAGYDPLSATRLRNMAIALTGTACGQPAVPGATPAPTGDTPPAEEEGRNGAAWFFGLLLLVLVGALVYVGASRAAKAREKASKAVKEPELMPIDAPVMTSSDGGPVAEVTPVARFQTAYRHGHDTYDDSFSIETGTGDFLGECGVSVSEFIGPENPRHITAFEVWLFDKNDIRTVTKVIMSDHAYYDEAIRAKLAPRGEPFLVRDGETVVLETASLIINAKVSNLAYGTGTSLPPNSYFEHFNVELSAWSKAGDYGEPNVQGRIDEMLALE